MIIATSITEDYFHKSLPFFDSINKHFVGKKICFCIGFLAEFEGWEMIYVDPKTLSCKIEGFPKNRNSYYSLQHGEFTKYYKFKLTDLILFLDSDMILQRDFKTQLEEWNGQFLVTKSSFPPTMLKDVILHKGFDCKISQEEFCEKYKITTEKEFCAGFIIASAKSWIRLYNDILVSYKDFLSLFSHHASWQLLINYIILKYHDFQVLPPLVQNAEWYNGTDATVIDNTLMWNGEKVYFNHTKFIKEFTY